jgi:hypothetical protein
MKPGDDVNEPDWFHPPGSSTGGAAPKLTEGPGDRAEGSGATAGGGLNWYCTA